MTWSQSGENSVRSSAERTGVKDFHLLVRLRVFETEQMNHPVFAFCRYADSSLSYAGIDSHPDLTHYSIYDTVVARDHAEAESTGAEFAQRH